MSQSFIGFNAEMTKLAAGSDSGLQMFELPPAGPFRRIKNDSSFGSVALVAICDATQQAVLVLDGRLHAIVYNMGTNEVISEFHFEDQVMCVKMNTTRIVVVLKRKIHVFDATTMMPLPQIATNTPPNSRGLAALSQVNSQGVCYLAYPVSDKSETRGDVAVAEATSTFSLKLIQAHDNPIAALGITNDGTKVATCSLKGTLIRVFANPNARLLFSLRRGNKEALIYCLAFGGAANDILAATSNSGTLHLFRCTGEGLGSGQAEQRSFAKVDVKDKGKTLCGISTDGKTLSVITPPTAGQETTLEQYGIGKDKCRKESEFRIR